MAGAAGALIQAALATKLAHLRQATASYLRDRTEQGRSTLNAYLIAIAFYAVAGVFMIAALLVGAAALFLWVADAYGLPMAFAVTIGGLIVLTVVAAIVAAAAMRPPRKSFPSLGSRLRVALHAGAPKQALSTRDAGAPSRAPPAPRSPRPEKPGSPTLQRAGLAAAVGLIGWALARRYGQPAPLPRTKGSNG